MAMENGTHHEFVGSTLARVQYFFGQLLTQYDLGAEQAYHVAIRRLMQREILGTGTVAGLAVRRSSTRDVDITIHPGLGIDRDGRELLLQAETSIRVADDVLTPGSPVDYGSDDPSVMAGNIRTAWSEAIGADDIKELQAVLEAIGFSEVSGDTGTNYHKTRLQLEKLGAIPSDFVLPPSMRLVDYFFDRLVGASFVALRYHERGADPAPSVLDGSCCTSGCAPSRSQQGVDIVTASFPPPLLRDPFFHSRMFLERYFENDQNPATGSPTGPWEHNCQDAIARLLIHEWHDLPTLAACPPADLPLLSLACIGWSRFARDPDTEPRIFIIDQINCRPLAPGGPALRALTEALTQCQTSVAIPPRFARARPRHRDNRLVADPANPTTDFFAECFSTSRLDDNGGDPDAIPWNVTFYKAGSGDDPPVYDLRDPRIWRENFRRRVESIGGGRVQRA